MPGSESSKLEKTKLAFRLAEITYTVLIATPAAVLILRGEFPVLRYLLALTVGAALTLTFIWLGARISMK